jgi:hypothetical protein
VVDLNHQRIYVHRAPADGAYAERATLTPFQTLSAQFAPTTHFTVDEILGIA